jgi:osmotically inducible protein OsmC
MKELYHTTISVSGGRDGKATSDDGHLAVVMALPKVIGGSGEGTNPEQLFGAAFAGCFTSSLRYAATQKKLSPDGVGVDATVTMGLYDDGRYGLKAALEVRPVDWSDDEFSAVLAEAERICAFSNAVRGNIDLTITRAR